MRAPSALESSALGQSSSISHHSSIRLRSLEKPFLILADVVALAVGCLTWRPSLISELSAFHFDTLSSTHALLPQRALVFSIVTVLAIGIFWMRGHYSRRIAFWHEARQVFKYSFFLALINISALFFSNLDDSRASTLLTWIAVPILIVSLRALVKTTFYRLGGWVRPALIIGTGQNALDCARAVESESMMGLKVAAFVASDDGACKVGKHLTYRDQQYPILALNDAMSWMKTDKALVPQIFMALDNGQLQANIGLVGKLGRLTQHMYVVPSFRGLPLVGLETSHFFGQDMAVLWVPNNLARRGPQFIKRMFDIVVSASLLFVIAPLLAILASRVWQSGGPVLFGHQRIGRRGEPFTCYKFRTMVPSADKVLNEVLATNAAHRAEWEKDHKLKKDPRVTKIGAYMRRTSLDELPQLWNVLKGEMSLVGPRPIVDNELVRYGEHSDYYLECRPGITGLWQISGRNDVDYAARVQLDTWYARNWSMWYDVVILLRTIRVVFARNGAY